MVSAQQARRIDQVRVVHRVQNVLHSHVRPQHSRRIGRDLKLRLLSSLHQNAGHPIQPVQPRLELIGGQFPKLRLRNFVRGEAVTQNRKARKIKPMRINLSRRRQRALDSRNRGFHLLQRQHHVYAPVEVQIDFRRTAAGNRVHLLQSLNAIDRFLDGPRNRHFHLVDGHDAIVHADDNSRKVRRGKHGDRKGKSLVDSHHGQRENHEDDRFRVARKPVAIRIVNRCDPSRRWRRLGRRIDRTCRCGRLVVHDLP